MASMRIGLFGPLRADREGVPIKFRTVQQGLLLARLAVDGGPMDRGEIAAALWPGAERENALAYLRRAIMELRKAGFEIETPGARVALDARAYESDLGELLAAIQGSFSLLPQATILDGIEHPEAEDVREAVRRALEERQRHKATPPLPELKGAPDLLRWIWEALLRDRPEVASGLLATEGLALVAEFPSDAIVEVYLQALHADPPLDAARVTLRQVVARSAHVQTRYALAERLYREAIADADALGRPDLALTSFSQLAFLFMERRQWTEARSISLRCVEESERSGDLSAIEAAHTNLAGLLWHLLEFEASVAHYRRAIEIAPPLKRIVPVANLAYLWGVFGVAPGMDFRPDLAAMPTDGYRGIADAYLQFSCGMGEGDTIGACVGAGRLVELTAKSGMERLFCVALDCAAMALARRDRPEPAAACVRLGSRVRRDVDHRRSPGERLALRRNVGGPLFGRTDLQGLRSRDPARLGGIVLKLLQSDGLG